MAVGAGRSSTGGPGGEGVRAIDANTIAATTAIAARAPNAANATQRDARPVIALPQATHGGRVQQLLVVAEEVVGLHRSGSSIRRRRRASPRVTRWRTLASVVLCAAAISE